jgi:hypothetical protein
MQAYLIDPALRRATDIEIADDVGKSLADMRRLIGCTGLDSQNLSDMHDTLWCNERALVSGPVFAFQFRNKHGKAGPFGGRCIIVGADSRGEPAPPHIPLAWVQNDIDWLDEIVPELTMIEEMHTLPSGAQFLCVRTVVTYTRVK